MATGNFFREIRIGDHAYTFNGMTPQGTRDLTQVYGYICTKDGDPVSDAFEEAVLAYYRNSTTHVVTCDLHEECRGFDDLTGIIAPSEWNP